jgi:hypothetical protein
MLSTAEVAGHPTPPRHHTLSPRPARPELHPPQGGGGSPAAAPPRTPHQAQAPFPHASTASTLLPFIRLDRWPPAVAAASAVDTPCPASRPVPRNRGGTGHVSAQEFRLVHRIRWPARQRPRASYRLRRSRRCTGRLPTGTASRQHAPSRGRRRDATIPTVARPAAHPAALPLMTTPDGRPMRTPPAGANAPARRATKSEIRPVPRFTPHQRRSRHAAPALLPPATSRQRCCVAAGQPAAPTSATTSRPTPARCRRVAAGPSRRTADPWRNTPRAATHSLRPAPPRRSQPRRTQPGELGPPVRPTPT